MKKSIFILLIILIASCVKITKSEPLFIYADIISKYHKDAETIEEYHFGYDVWDGEFEYHYGPHTIPEINEVTFIFFGDSITFDDKTLYFASKIDIKYKQIYYDGIFHHNRIISIKPIKL